LLRVGLLLLEKVKLVVNVLNKIIANPLDQLLIFRRPTRICHLFEKRDLALLLPELLNPAFTFRLDVSHHIKKLSKSPRSSLADLSRVFLILLRFHSCEQVFTGLLRDLRYEMIMINQPIPCLRVESV
jgi:hypothetical protein